MSDHSISSLQFIACSSPELVVPFIKEYKEPDLMSVISSPLLMFFPNLFDRPFLKKVVGLIKESLFRPCLEPPLEP